MTIVVDAATPGLDLDELAAAGAPQVPYTGNGLPSQDWFDAARARGLDPPWLIQETISQRSQLGFDAGVQDCLFAERRARSRGHTGRMAYVLSDGNGRDAWDTSEYVRGVLDTATLPTDIWYGALGVGANWVPETWGGGAFATQLVYEKSPAISVGHDLNEVHADLGTPAPAPVRENPDMLYKAAGDSTSNPAVTDGTVWAIVGYDFVHADELVGQVPVLTVDGEQLGANSVALQAAKHGALGTVPPAPEPLDITTVSAHDLIAEMERRFGGS